MTREKRKFTAEFKDEAVRLALGGEKSVTQTARDLGLGDSTLHGWISAWRKRNGSEQSSGGEVNLFQLQEENRQLREQNRRLQMERDLLKKATAYFASESK